MCVQLLPAVRKQGMLRTLTAVEVANQTLAAQGHLSPRQAGQRHSYSHLPGTAPYLDEGMGIVPAAAGSYQVRQYHCSCTAFPHPPAVPLLLHCLAVFSHCFFAPIHYRCSSTTRRGLSGARQPRSGRTLRCSAE